MDYRRGESGYSNPNVVQINPGSTANDNYGSIYGDDAIWATEEDYGAWNSEASMDARTQLGMEPPEKRSRNSQSLDINGQNRSKVIGKMFYKTKLCCKFRAGTCPYITNCNFAHSVEELRKPPPNWQDIVANHDEERGVSSEPREEYQIPILGVNDDSQRSFKGRRCKKFYTEEGCPYGDSCTFLHDEQSRARESVAISLGPGPGPGPGAGGGGHGNNVGNVVNLKPSNWKTRICNKWELTGYCPFGSKCHFAHGAAELNHYGGGAMDSEQKDPSMVDVSSKQGTAPSLTAGENVVAALVPPLPQNDGYHHVGVSAQRISNALPRNGGRANQKWKGPDKISKIYGDWIDDL